MPNRSKQGTYYLGRVVFQGELDKLKLLEALKTPISIGAGEHHWTITDYNKYEDRANYFIYGKLTKYKPKGEVNVIDTRLHSEIIKEIDNTKVASSPFVYLPEYSGIAYLHVWNLVQQEIFVRRFKELVEKKYDNFFVECNIEAISDLIAFYKRISELSSIELIRAKVRPPNPMFGPLWESLKEYLKKREINELILEEKAYKGAQIQSELKSLINFAEKEKLGSRLPIPDITDAAILMATDGYGQGKVHGIEGKKKVVIATSDTIKNFKYDTEPDPIKLFEITRELFKDITQKRHMEHEKKDS